ncbi:MAG: S1 RNA-binding domain-containing protein [Anaerolineales bacterium]
MNTKTKINDQNNNFEELLEDYESIRPNRGQIVQGEVLELTEDTVLLDVGAKRDAVVPARELANLDETLFEDLSIGDQLPVFITNTSSYDDELLVSIERGLEQRDWERARAFLESGEIQELKIIGYNKGGLLVGFGRLDGFVPNSMVPDLPRGLTKSDRQNLKAKMISDSVQAKVIEVNQPRKRLILSGKAAESNRREERLQELEAGERITGTVSNVVDFGVFVNLDGVDGLIHRSRLSWEDFEHPSDVLRPGEEVEVLIKDVDIERERVSLDRRALLPGPWDDFTQEYSDGDIIEGEVVSVRDFGAFVKLTDEITGLLHVSELLPGVSRDPTKVLNPGDEILVRIIEIDKEQERVSLSMRRLPDDEIANWVIEN